MKLLVARYSKEASSEEIESLRNELKNAVGDGEESGVGVALVREDVELDVIDFDDYECACGEDDDEDIL